ELSVLSISVLSIVCSEPISLEISVGDVEQEFRKESPMVKDKSSLKKNFFEYFLFFLNPFKFINLHPNFYYRNNLV
ncbi:MAG: hypothetical protein L6Q37_08745, partial [Bdellovibrionaceae bacterium]|nr:hypothetical protein [Pseudobdellovibrionaceae bacterium]